MARTFAFPRPRPRGLIGRKLEADEQLVLGAGLITGLFMLWILPGTLVKIVGFVAVAGSSAAATLVPYQGRTYLKWFEINRTYRRLRRSGELLYKSTAPYAGRTSTGKPVPVALPPGVPRDLRWIDASTAFGQIAILMQPEEMMFTCGIEIEGERDFGSLDTEDKEALVQAYEYLLTSTADSGGRIRRLQWIARIIPTDPNAHARDAYARRDPAAAEWLHASYDELQRQVAVTAEDRRLLLVLGIPYTSDLVAEARRYTSLHQGFAVTLGKEVEAFIRNLGRGQLRHVRNLDEPALASYIHHAYGPGHWIDDTLGMDRATAWPAEVDARDSTRLASRSFESADSWYSATAWIKQWPMVAVHLNFLAPLLLYVKDVIFTVSVTMDLIPGDRAIDEAMADSTNELGQADRRAGKIVDPRETKAQRTSLSTLAEIADGAVGTHLAGWITVTSPSSAALDRHKDDIRAAAARCQLRLEWTDKEHHRAFANTLPFCGGLLKG